MKTIIVLANLFSGDMLKDYDYLKENLDMSKYNLVSPASFLVEDNKYNADDFVFKIIANGINLSKAFNEVAAIANNNKTNIYYGFATDEIKRNNIYVVNKNVVNTQESFLKELFLRGSLKLNYIISDMADKEFDTIEDLVRNLNEVQ